MATRIADTLRGKGKPVYTSHVDTGDFVVVVNAEKIAVTGSKLDTKIYYRHSGYPGGIKQRTLREQLERRPTEVLEGREGDAAEESSRTQLRSSRSMQEPSIRTPRRRRSGGARERARAVPRHRQAQDVGRSCDPAPGDGKTWINGRTIEEYFPRAVHRKMVMAPLEVAEAVSTYDLRVRVHGGGVSGQAGAVRHGIARALVEADPAIRVPLKRQGFLRATLASSSEEGGPAQGAQGASVLEA